MAKKSETESQQTNAKLDATGFFKETQEELKKVVWPSRQQLISESAAVLLMVSLSAALIYLVDGLFNWVSQQVF